MRVDATVPIELVESETPIPCNVEYYVDKGGNVTVGRVSKPIGNNCYADIEVPKKTMDWLESFYYDNVAEY